MTEVFLYFATFVDIISRLNFDTKISNIMIYFTNNRHIMKYKILYYNVTSLNTLTYQDDK